MSKRHSGAVSEADALAAEMQRLGFTEYEAKAYLALLQLQGPSTAYEISKGAAIPRANAYSVLETLSAKRAVQPVSQSPLRYVALDPDVLLGRILEETSAQCEQLGHKLLRFRTSRTDNEHVWRVSGAFEVNAKIGEMIDTAEQHIWIKAHEDHLLPHEPRLRAAAGRGVQVVVVLFGSDAQRFTYGGESQTYLHEGNGIPVGEAHHLITFTRDFVEALMVNMDQGPYGAYTRNRPTVNMAASLLRHEVYIAELFNELGDEIEEKFGPAMWELRRKYLPGEQSKRLFQLLSEMGAFSGERVPELQEDSAEKIG